jgi:hypothetical protein
VPISPPVTTRALLDMFWALNGATRRPWRAKWRHSTVASRLLPAQLEVPWTMIVRAAIRAADCTECRVVSTTERVDAATFRLPVER